MKLTGESLSTRGEKPVPVPLCPPQIPHGLTRDRSRASAVGGRRHRLSHDTAYNFGLILSGVATVYITFRQNFVILCT
jgi:hypothetical protein